MKQRKYRFSLIAAGVTALALAFLASPASAGPPAPDRDSPQISQAELPTPLRFVAHAVPADGSTANQQPPDAFECLWGWNVEVGGYYPEAWMQYAATFECSQIGPDVAGTIRGSLHDAPGGLTLHTGPDEGFAWCCFLVYPPVTSGGEITLAGPGSFYINSDSIVDLLPDSQGTIWLWTYLPEGCSGIGSPRAICDIDSEAFDIT